MNDGDKEVLADRIGDLIYNNTQLVRSDAEDLAWEVLDLIEGDA